MYKFDFAMKSRKEDLLAVIAVNVCCSSVTPLVWHTC